MREKLGGKSRNRLAQYVRIRNIKNRHSTYEPPAPVGPFAAVRGASTRSAAQKSDRFAVTYRGILLPARERTLPAIKGGFDKPPSAT